MRVSRLVIIDFEFHIHLRAMSYEQIDLFSDER